MSVKVVAQKGTTLNEKEIIICGADEITASSGKLVSDF